MMTLSASTLPVIASHASPVYWYADFSYSLSPTMVVTTNTSPDFGVMSVCAAKYASMTLLSDADRSDFVPS